MKKIAVLILIVWSCASPAPTAQEVVDRAIEVSGTENIRNADASFVFRNIKYVYEAGDGRFAYTRIQSDTAKNEVKDVLTNDGLKRYINGNEAVITEERRTAYTSSVNSVIYFAFLPSSLNDAAVNKELIGTVSINDKSYYKIKITFDIEGGGEDYEDVFYYWFDTEDYSMDYLAYSYNEDDGQGIRFRVAYNARKINGVVMQDYRNLKPIIDDSVPLAEIDEAYQTGKLEELSLIELEDVVISFR